LEKEQEKPGLCDGVYVGGGADTSLKGLISVILGVTEGTHRFFALSLVCFVD
jgi:hypothetical protein